MGHIAKYKYGFYYEQLDIDQQFVYRMVAAAVSGYEKEIDIAIGDKELHRIKMAVLYDNPEFFYWRPEDSKVVSEKMNLAYSTESKEEASNLVIMLRAKRRTVLQDLWEDNMFQIDIFTKVYEYLVYNVKYAEGELQKPGCAPWIYDIQGPMLLGRGVCQGIAQTLNYFCATLHIPSILVTGEAKVAGWRGNHGWNMVKFGEEYYHVDATCEICNNEIKDWRYFLKKDSGFADHQWPKSIYPQSI